MDKVKNNSQLDELLTFLEGEISNYDNNILNLIYISSKLKSKPTSKPEEIPARDTDGSLSILSSLIYSFKDKNEKASQIITDLQDLI